MHMFCNLVVVAMYVSIHVGCTVVENDTEKRENLVEKQSCFRLCTSKALLISRTVLLS